MELGLGKEVQSTVKAPFGVTKAEPFHKAYLIEVKSEMKTFEKGANAGKAQAILSFTFVSPDKTKKHVETYFPLDASKPTFKDSIGYLNQKIKHLFEAYAVFPDNGIGQGSESFEAYYKAIADAFNGVVEGKEDTPIYKSKLVWLYLTYNNKGRLQIPFPNFIELVHKDKNEDKPNTLFVKDKDVVDKPAVNTSIAKVAGGSNEPAPDDLPDDWK